MSFYYSIGGYNFATPLSFTTLFQQQSLIPVPNLYVMHPEPTFFQNLNQEFQQTQMPIKLASSAYIAFTQESQRPLTSQEPVKRRNVKKCRKRNVEKELQSARKNSESNIINQLYSFFNTMQKSEKIVDKTIRLLGKNQCQIQKIKVIFYNTVRLMNYKRGRGYVNKQTIKRFYTPQTFLSHIPDIIQKLQDIGILSLEELCHIFRVCTYHFVRDTSVVAILSSKRISMLAKRQHLKRRRLVQKRLLDFDF